MPLLPLFDPPGNLNDITDPELRRRWSAVLAQFFRSSLANLNRPGETAQFYNPLETETTDPVKSKTIDWNGFPKLVKDAFPGDAEAAWREAEPTQSEPERRSDFQDEYLEWNVVRNGQGKIVRVSFTCEGPEYWKFLANNVPDKLLELYRSLVDPALSDQVRIEDLIVGGSYRPQNKWNTLHGAIHLIQPNNNLGAEVQIAADSTILWSRNGQPVTDSDVLIQCGGFGARGRNSDPRIGIEVNRLARTGAALTLRNPVALYVTEYKSTGFKKPDGSAVGDYWKVVRGLPKPPGDAPAQALHLVYEVPPGEGFVVGDIKIGLRNIEFGGQLAEFIKVGLTGLACREGGIQNPSRTCSLPHPAPAVLAAADAQARRALHVRMPAGQRLSRASTPIGQAGDNQ